MSRTKKTLIGLVAASLLVVAFPVSALAQTEEQRPRAEVTDEARHDRLERAKRYVTNQIERRLGTIDRLTGKVTSARFVTDDHEASLLRDYAAAIAILIAGLDSVAAVETMEELREVAPAIFEDTLVYALLSPKTHAVVASDAVVGVSDHFTEIAARLQDALDRLAEAGIDIADAQADLDVAVDLVAEAEAAGGGVAETVIGLQPGNEYKEPLAEARATLRRTKSLLRDARGLTKGVIRFIRSVAVDQGGET